jgi:hypothetical protein
VYLFRYALYLSITDVKCLNYLYLILTEGNMVLQILNIQKALYLYLWCLVCLIDLVKFRT